MNKHLVALLLVCIMPTLYAQRVELGVTGGGSYYMGDLNPEKPFELTQPAYGFVFRYNFNNRIAVKANLLRGDVRGDDLITQYRIERGINFKSYIYELALMMEFNFFDYFTGSSRNFISPYIFGGVGSFMFNPRATYGSTTYVLRNERTEGVDYSVFGAGSPAMSICFPFGIGVKYSLTDVIGMTMEWGMRKTMTDYLDDVHGVYPARTLNNQGEPEPYLVFVDPTQSFNQGMQRGNSKDNDWYAYAGVSVVFRINFKGKAQCDEPHRMRF